MSKRTPCRTSSRLTFSMNRIESAVWSSVSITTMFGRSSASALGAATASGAVRADATMTANAISTAAAAIAPTWLRTTLGSPQSSVPLYLGTVPRDFDRTRRAAGRSRAMPLQMSNDFESTRAAHVSDAHRLYTQRDRDERRRREG